jgi:hypothetical protein
MKMYMYIQKLISNKLRKNNNVLLASCRSLTKIARFEAGSGYISTSRGTGPRIQIRTNMSRIRNTSYNLKLHLFHNCGNQILKLLYVKKKTGHLCGSTILGPLCFRSA